MRKIVWLLALFVSVLNVASNATQSGDPSTKKACPGHGHQPGGSAVDINAVNGKPVSNYGKDPEVTKGVDDLQAAANRSGLGEPGAAEENYGPAGLWRNGKRVRDAKLQNRFHDYVHVLPPKTRASK